MTAKPMGPIPPDHAASGMLMLGGEAATALVERHGSPLFVYDMGVVAARVARFRAAMPAGVALHYAIKANPLPALLARMAPLVDGFDVASQGEMAAAFAVQRADLVSFAGPGKSAGEIQAAVIAGVTLNVESAREVEVALSMGCRPKLAIRVNPSFELRGSGMRMGGGAKPFGIDEDEVPALVRRIVDAGAEWRGLHVYAGSQTLDAEALIEAQRQTVMLAARIADEAGVAPPSVNLGGGFGVPYFAGDEALDVERVGTALGRTLDEPPSTLDGCSFAIELGRWLVAEAGVYLTTVLDRKTSHGETFLVTDGGLHHQLAASGNFGTVVRRNYPLAVADRIGAEPQEVATVAGRLCTPLDRLGDRVALPRAEEGDLIAIFLAGAYGATASPTAFLGHPPAGEIVVG